MYIQSFFPFSTLLLFSGQQPAVLIVVIKTEMRKFMSYKETCVLEEHSLEDKVKPVDICRAPAGALQISLYLRMIYATPTHSKKNKENHTLLLCQFHYLHCTTHGSSMATWRKRLGLRSTTQHLRALLGHSKAMHSRGQKSILETLHLI